MPDRSRLQPANVATPATAAFEVPPVQVRVALPGSVSTRVTTPVSFCTVPLEFFMVTVGCVVRAVPAVPPPGWVVNDSSPVEVIVRLALLTLVAVQPPTTALTRRT